MKKKISFIKNEIISFEFSRYFVAGVTGFLVDLLVLNILTFYFFNNDDPELIGIVSLSKLLSAFVGTTVSFLVNSQWSFKNKTGKFRSHAFRMIIVFFTNILLAALIYSLIIDIIELQKVIDFEKASPSLANFLTSAIQMLLNFFIYKYIVFISKSK